MSEIQKPREESIIEILRRQSQLAQTYLRKTDVPKGMVSVWSTVIRNQLEKIFGRDSPFLNSLPRRGMDSSIADPRSELVKRFDQLQCIITALESVSAAATSPQLGNRIFIGHGRSHVWLQLKDFITSRLGIPCEEFNIEPAAGISTTARLEAMLANTRFAFVVMTAEEEHVDGKKYARPNVIHESGLFQGKLGNNRAIILLEEGCATFSNIAGLTQIRFPHEDLKSVFEEVRGVLEREGLI